MNHFNILLSVCTKQNLTEKYIRDRFNNKMYKETHKLLRNWKYGMKAINENQQEQCPLAVYNRLKPRESHGGSQDGAG